ncbi:MAG: hypothetical protein ACJ0Q1_01050 [Luminiphilus sp.]
MKYLFFVILSTLLLAGCGQSDEPAVAETEETSDANGASAEPSAPVADGASGDSETTAASGQTAMSADSPVAQGDTQKSASASDESAESTSTESNGGSSVAPAAAIAAKANKKAAIRAEASSSSEAVTSIDKNSDISLGSRSGIWYAVQSPSEGWIKITDVAIPSSGNGSSVLAGLASGRLGGGNSVASSGARGLDGDAVVTGAPDFEAVKELAALQDSGDSLGADFFTEQDEREITNTEENAN